MRLLIYYSPRKNKIIINYKQDRQREYKLGSTNNYGHVIIQYWYILDHKIFFERNKYERYIEKRINKPKLRYRIGQKIIKLGKYICFGKEEKVKVIYVNKYPYWKRY